MKPEPKPGSNRAPVLKAAIARLRQLALATPKGEFLGSEQELSDLLGISRPTFRQAVRVAEQDQLLEKRMGPHGGCYASRPDSRTTARAAALYLQVAQANLGDLMQVLHGLQQCLLALACESDRVEEKARLRVFLDRLAMQGPPEGLAHFLEAERQFEQLVIDIAGNPALSLFLQIARQFVDESAASQVLIAKPAMRRMRCTAWARLGEAILAGDAAQALAIADEQAAAFAALVPGDTVEAWADGID